MKTFNPKSENIKRDWFLVDARGKTLGRLATTVAARLRGKHKPEYSPHNDMGDYIVIINAKHILVTGNKTNQKLYHHHTGYPGGLKSIAFEKLIAKKPTLIIEKAVKGMLPKNALGRKMNKKLKVYPSDIHPHSAQQLKMLAVQ